MIAPGAAVIGCHMAHLAARRVSDKRLWREITPKGKLGFIK
jgi:hypothetical protein